MKVRLISTFFLTCILILSGCSLFRSVREQDRERLLIENLEKWRNFRIDGIIEMNYKSFSLRKNISIRKDNDLGKIDIFDTGLFGLRPTPFISIRIDSLITIDLPEENQPLVMNSSELLENQPSFHYLMHLNDLTRFKEEILDGMETEIDSIIFRFSPDLKIISIGDAGGSDKIELSYLDDLSGIALIRNDMRVANIQIDNISYGDIKIDRSKN